MMPIPILAHGALGVFDELIFAGVGVVFLIMMAISWLRSRNAPPDDEVDQTSTPHDTATDPQATDKFRLE
jgi:hypothetical protein